MRLNKEAWSRLTRIVTTFQDRTTIKMNRNKKKTYRNVSECVEEEEEEEEDEAEEEKKDQEGIDDQSANDTNAEINDQQNDTNSSNMYSQKTTTNGNKTNENEQEINRSCLKDELCFQDYIYPAIDVPKKYEEAVESSEKEEWQEAMKNEMDSFKEHNAFSLTHLPENCKVIGGEWVYSFKRNPENGKRVRAARYVANGSTQQQYGVDYVDTYSPTAKIESMRLLMQLAAEKEMIVHHLDMKTAYLNAPIDREVYVVQPKGFIGQSPEDNDKKESPEKSKGNDQKRSKKQAGYNDTRRYRREEAYDDWGRNRRRAKNDDWGRNRRQQEYYDRRRYKRREEFNDPRKYRGQSDYNEPRRYRKQGEYIDPKKHREHSKDNDQKRTREQSKGNDQKGSMDQTEGNDPKETTDEQPGATDDRVWKLNKSMYGLKQSGKNWHAFLKSAMEEKGFKRSAVDACMYYFKAKPGLEVFIIFCNKDVIVSASTKELLDEAKSFLKEKFKTNDLGPISWLKGIEFKQYQNFVIEMTQSHYLNRVLKKFGVIECEPRSTPCEEILPADKNKEKSFIEENLLQSRCLKELMSKLRVSEFGTGFTQCKASSTKEDIEKGINQEEDKKSRYLKGILTKFGIKKSGYTQCDLSPQNDDEEEEIDYAEDDKEIYEEYGSMNETEDGAENGYEGEDESVKNEESCLTNEGEERIVTEDGDKKTYKEINGEIRSIVEYDEEEFVHDENIEKEENFETIEDPEKIETLANIEVPKNEENLENEDKFENEENLKNEEEIENEENTVTEEEKKEFREILENLMYAMRVTRPDLSWVVTELSRKMTCPDHSDLLMVKQVLQYVKGTVNYKMTFRKSKIGLKLIGYSDADWDGASNISGYCFTVNESGGPLISWTSKQQPDVALSSCEAEYQALNMATKEALLLKILIKDFDISCEEPVKLLAGNRNSIALIKGPSIHLKSKHITTIWKNTTLQTKLKQSTDNSKWKNITDQTLPKHSDIKYDLIKDRGGNKAVDICYINSDDNIADVMTKLQPSNKLNSFHKQLFGKP